MTYTAACVAGVIGAVLLDLLLLRTRLVLRRAFWTAYTICLMFQLLVNGVLTGRGVVTYSPHAVEGSRLAYAPVEDIAFGFSLVLQALWWGVGGGRRARHAGRGAGAAPAAGGGVPPRPRRSSTP